MPSEFLYFIPGFLGSELAYSSTQLLFPGQTLWVDRAKLVACKFSDLAYQDGKPKVDLLPTNVLREAYGATVDSLKKFVTTYTEGGQRRFHDLVVIPYDWRMSNIDNGKLLAALIEQTWEKHPSDKVSIVCHSMGGILARCAYRELKTLGFNELVRRIITLSTPHLGSYNVCQLLAGKQTTVFDLAMAKSLFAGSAVFAGGFDNVIWNQVQITSTWPATYELLTKFEWDKFEDPQNPAAWIPDNYDPRAGVDAQLMSHAKDVFWPYISDQQFWPDDNVMTTVVGTNTNTASTVRSAKDIKEFFNGFNFGDGDETVPDYSSSNNNFWKRRYEVASKHSWIHRDPRVLADLPKWILEEGVPSAPTVIPGSVRPSQSRPPGTDSSDSPQTIIKEVAVQIPSKFC